MNVSRRKAMIFADSGKVDHEGEKTLFGQIRMQNKNQRPDMSNFKQNSTDQNCWTVDFAGEGSMDYGGPFRDALVNICNELESDALPLLIKTANNRSEVGTNRECYLLNPEANSPTHFEMFHYLGCILGFAIMSKSPIPLNLAPSVWKQLLGDQMTLNDLDCIDTLSAKILKDLQGHSKTTASEEEFEMYSGSQNFVTVLSHGTEVPLCSDGFTKKVTRENLPEYIRLVILAR